MSCAFRKCPQRVSIAVADITWENQKDQLLPGYRREWESTRPGGGEVVGVTGREESDRKPGNTNQSCRSTLE